MRVAFLFGAGISIPAGMPSTTDLTNSLLTGERVTRESDMSYHLWQPDEQPTPCETYVPTIVNFLNYVRKLCEEFHGESHQVNYEDLYHVVRQLHDSSRDEFENPALLPLAQRIREDLLDRRPRTGSITSVPYLASETARYTEDVVRQCLVWRDQDVTYLNWIAEACLDPSVCHADILTLNHDSLLDLMLRNSKVPFVDGFGECQRDGVRYWDPSEYDKASPRTRLMKLHGSVDWSTFKDPVSGRLLTGICVDSQALQNAEDAYSAEDMFFARQGEPRMLIGTFNKILMYTVDMFADVYVRFYTALQATNHLVISGYSFGDKVINASIRRFLERDEKTRVVIIHPKPDELKSTARGAIQNAWKAFRRQGKLRFVEAWIEDADWTKMRDVIGG